MRGGEPQTQLFLSESMVQVYPTWAKRSPDLAEAFQDWVRRARLYYGEVEAAAAIQGMDRFLEAASLEDRTAVLAELRRLHVMADPHRCHPRACPLPRSQLLWLMSLGGVLIKSSGCQSGVPSSGDQSQGDSRFARLSCWGLRLSRSESTRIRQSSCKKTGRMSWNTIKTAQMLDMRQHFPARSWLIGDVHCSLVILKFW